MAKQSSNRNIFLYATPDELADWLKKNYQDYSFSYAFARANDELLLPLNLDWDDQTAVLQAISQHTDLYLSTEPINTCVESVGQLATKNPSSLWIHFPKLTMRGFSYGIIGKGDGDAKLRRMLRSMLVDLENRTTAGVWFAVPGQEPFLDLSVRYTPGAAELWRGGTPLLGGGATRVARLVSNESGSS